MSPLTPAMFATLFDKEIGVDGNMYVATMVNGDMTWVMDTPNTGGNKTKNSKQRSKKQDSCSSQMPSILAMDSLLFNFEQGINGNMYINNLVNGELSWDIPNINHDWNNCVTCDISLDNIDMRQSGSKKKSSSTRSKKKSINS